MPFRNRSFPKEKYCGFALFMALCATLPAFGQEPLRRPTPKKPASIAFKSNVPGATIAVDGIVAGRAGSSIEATPGVMSFVIAAPGYYTRAVRAVITSEGETPLVVNLAPSKGGDSEYEPPAANQVRFKDPFNTGGVVLCKTSEPANSSACAPESWLDDIHFAGLSWADPATIIEAPSRQEWQRLRAELWAENVAQLKKPNQDWFKDAETLFATQPGNVAVYQLLAAGSLLHADCGRTLQITSEARAMTINDPRLQELEALCQELAGNDTAAQTAYAAAQNPGKGLVAPPEAKFHALRFAVSRAKANSSGTLALSGLVAKAQAVTQSLPRYFPGFVLLHRLSIDLGQGNDGAYARYIKASTPSVVLQTIRERLADSDANTAADLAHAGLGVSPKNFMYGWEAALAEAAKNPTVSFHKVAPLVENLTLGDYNLAKDVLQDIEASGRGDFKEAAYQDFLKVNPRSGFFRFKLAKLYRDEKRFTEAVHAADLGLGGSEPRTETALLTVKASALIKLKNYQGAADAYRALSALEPSDWHHAYNLGVALSAAGASAQGKTALEKALSLSPPPAIAAQIKAQLAAKPKLAH